jgi:hypothetical protein
MLLNEVWAVKSTSLVGGAFVAGRYKVSTWKASVEERDPIVDTPMEKSEGTTVATSEEHKAVTIGKRFSNGIEGDRRDASVSPAGTG